MNKTIDYMHKTRLIWRGSEQESICATHSSGYEELDSKLLGGWPSVGIIEIASPIGIGELRLFLPYLKQQQKLLVFINPPGLICAELIHHYGLNTEKLIAIYPKNSNDGLWASEKCLKSGACSAVLFWQKSLSVQQVRRLQSASEVGKSVLYFLHESKERRASLPVTLSVSLSPNEKGLNVEIIKRKGGWPLPAFKVDMTKHWPVLKLHRSANVVKFPASNVALK